MNLGFGELILVLVIVLVLFGAKRLPALGEGLGKAIRGIKDGLGGGEPPAGTKAEPGDGPRKELPPDEAARK
jgi:sec-independent protein translocase protein TatA